MKYILLFIFCSIGISASAQSQWWRVNIKLFKKPERLSPIFQSQDHSIARLQVVSKPFIQTISTAKLERSDYSIEVEQAMVMKEAQHNMRFHVYYDASYNFSELARLYLLQNRFSEAKWYLLQSTKISRQQNDDKHTIANLVQLATIKANIGEFTMAQQDLKEARELALSRGLASDVKTVDAVIKYIKQNRLTLPKADLHYAASVENNNKGD